MSFIELPFSTLMCVYLIFVMLYALITKKALYRIFFGLSISAYIIGVFYKLIFPMPMIEKKAAASSYSFLCVDNYFYPFSFLLRHPKACLLSAIQSFPVGVYLGYRLKGHRHFFLWFFLFPFCISSLFVIVCVLANQLSGINYISISTDTVLAMLVGIHCGEWLCLLLSSRIASKKEDGN